MSPTSFAASKAPVPAPPAIGKKTSTPFAEFWVSHSSFIFAELDQSPTHAVETLISGFCACAPSMYPVMKSLMTGFSTPPTAPIAPVLERPAATIPPR